VPVRARKRQVNLGRRHVCKPVELKSALVRHSRQIARPACTHAAAMCSNGERA
jgi:hypothetical protein